MGSLRKCMVLGRYNPIFCGIGRYVFQVNCNIELVMTANISQTTVVSTR